MKVVNCNCAREQAATSLEFLPFVQETEKQVACRVQLGYTPNAAHQMTHTS